MDEISLYERILQLQPPWFVESVELREADGAVIVHVQMDEDAALTCPLCAKPAPHYDKRRRQWRHLDTCQYQTLVEAEVPRVNCEQHGCRMIEVSWADRGVRFTQMFEVMVIEWLQEASMLAVGRKFKLSWNAVDAIMRRAVKRGLQRRQRLRLKRIGVDEVSFKKGHDYCTVITGESGQVIAVEDDRKKTSLKGFYDRLSRKQKVALRTITMDMAPAYISATLEDIPDAGNKIAFDKFHVAMYLSDAVDEVRKAERIQLYRARRYDELKGQRYLWLRNPLSLDQEQRQQLRRLRTIASRTGRAWSLREYAMSLWSYSSKGWATQAWLRWYGRAIRSRLQPVKIAATMIKKNLWGIVNAIVMRAHNAMAECVNSKIRILKIRARGFRSRQRFKTAILFHYGGLSLHP
jgi:transposase